MGGGPQKEKGGLTPTASSRLFSYKPTWLMHAYDGSLGTHLEPDATGIILNEACM